MANATSALRLSGMNSGLDTESIVNALTATTKGKINTKQREVLKLQAQQDAYRSLIASFNNLKNKYFDILNGNTSLKSTGLFNSFKSTLTNASGTNVNGVKVSSNINANTGIYNVKVHKVATQATLKSAAATGKATYLGGYTDSSKTYAMDVSVNGKTQKITFNGGTEAELRASINSQLDVFGKKSDGSNIVSFGADNKFTSSDLSAVISNSPTLYEEVQTFGQIDNLQTGNNTFAVTVGGSTKNVSFSTVSSDYFEDIFEDDGVTIKADADPEKVKLFKEVAANQREKKVYEAFESWDEGLDDNQKEQAGINIAQDNYNNDLNKVKDTMMRQMAEDYYQDKLDDNTYSDKEGDPNYKSLDDFIAEQNFTETDLNKYFANDARGQLAKAAYDAEVDRLDQQYQEATDKVIADKKTDAYNKYFAEAKQAAYNDAVSAGTIPSDKDDPAYVDIKDFNFTDADFQARTTEYGQYTAELNRIDTTYSGQYAVDYDSLSLGQKMEYFDKTEYTPANGDEDAFLSGYTAAQAAKDLNIANIENNLGAIVFESEAVRMEAKVNDDGTITLAAKGKYTGNPVKFSITQSMTNASDFGIDRTSTSGTTSQVDTTSKLSELGIAADADGNYSFSINGHDFSFSGDTTVSDMMKKINGSEAGVKMSYTTLTNQFTITANEYGANATIDIEDGAEGLLTTLGFAPGQNFTAGQNTILTINGVDIETNSNEYTVDGTTFTFSQVAEGATFTNEVTRDYSKPISAIKSFVEDYNKLIEEVYGYVDEGQTGDYYFLTDDDKEEMDLSESQETKWENLAKKGILYRDSTLTGIMSKLRSIIYNTVDAADGSKVGLYTLGITTSSNWADHGKLVFDESMTDEKFESVFAKYADEFCELFTNRETGISKQFTDVIDSATKTTGGPGERGVLVEKAGVSGTASATNNSIYNQIKNLKDTISRLQERYARQQERYWKIYANMETMLGSINSQTSYINQMMGM